MDIAITEIKEKAPKVVIPSLKTRAVKATSVYKSNKAIYDMIISNMASKKTNNIKEHLPSLL